MKDRHGVLLFRQYFLAPTKDLIIQVLWAYTQTGALLGSGAASKHGLWCLPAIQVLWFWLCLPVDALVRLHDGVRDSCCASCWVRACIYKASGPFLSCASASSHDHLEP